MAKAAIHLGYYEYILDISDAVKVGELLAKAEKYERVYGDNSTAAHYIYPNEDTEWQLRLLPDEFYRMAKLAGKPPKKS